MEQQVTQYLNNVPNYKIIYSEDKKVVLEAFNDANLGACLTTRKLMIRFIKILGNA